MATIETLANQLVIEGHTDIVIRLLEAASSDKPLPEEAIRLHLRLSQLLLFYTDHLDRAKEHGLRAVDFKNNDSKGS